MTVRVVVVAQTSIYREGLRAVLAAVRDISVEGVGASGEEALQLALHHSPEVVVLAVDLSPGDAASLIPAVIAVPTTPAVLAISAEEERYGLLAALEAGAHGYLTTDATPAELIEAVHSVASGETYVRPSAARLLAANARAGGGKTPRGRFGALSRREQAVLRLVAEGFSGVEIASRLGISSKTVAAYKERIQDKLGLAHRTEYVRFAIEVGILGRRHTARGPRRHLMASGFSPAPDGPAH